MQWIFDLVKCNNKEVSKVTATIGNRHFWVTTIVQCGSIPLLEWLLQTNPQLLEQIRNSKTAYPHHLMYQEECLARNMLSSTNGNLDMINWMYNHDLINPEWYTQFMEQYLNQGENKAYELLSRFRIEYQYHDATKENSLARLQKAQVKETEPEVQTKEVDPETGDEVNNVDNQYTRQSMYDIASKLTRVLVVAVSPSSCVSYLPPDILSLVLHHLSLPEFVYYAHMFNLQERNSLVRFCIDMPTSSSRSKFTESARTFILERFEDSNDMKDNLLLSNNIELHKWFFHNYHFSVDLEKILHLGQLDIFMGMYLLQQGSMDKFKKSHYSAPETTNGKSSSSELKSELKSELTAFKTELLHRTKLLMLCMSMAAKASRLDVLDWCLQQHGMCKVQLVKKLSRFESLMRGVAHSQNSKVMDWVMKKVLNKEKLFDLVCKQITNRDPQLPNQVDLLNVAVICESIPLIQRLFRHFKHNQHIVESAPRPRGPGAHG